MSVAATALAVLAVLAAGTSTAVEPDRHDDEPRLILVDRPRFEGHPCQAEWVTVDTPPPGAVPYVVDVCVHHPVARTVSERRPNSVRLAYEDP